MIHSAAMMMKPLRAEAAAGAAHGQRPRRPTAAPPCAWAPGGAAGSSGGSGSGAPGLHVHRRRRRDVEHALGARIAHGDAHHRGQAAHLLVPGGAPAAIRPGIGEHHAERRAQQHHRVGERDAVQRQWCRPAAARTARACAPAPGRAVRRLGDAHDLQARPGVRADRRAHEDHRQLACPSNSGCTCWRLGATCSAADRSAASRSSATATCSLRWMRADPAVPVRQPLGGDGGERAHDQAHQRHRHQRLEQREAGLRWRCAARRVIGRALATSRTVSTASTAPEGDAHPQHHALRNPRASWRPAGRRRRNTAPSRRRQRWPADLAVEIAARRDPRGSARWRAMSRAVSTSATCCSSVRVPVARRGDERADRRERHCHQASATTRLDHGEAALGPPFTTHRARQCRFLPSAS